MLHKAARMRRSCLCTIVVLAGVLAGAGSAQAHAVLTRSSLQGGTVRAGAATTVTLRFNSALEAGLSRVVLVDERGEERALEVGAAEERAELRVALPSLPPGAYGLRYKVLAADGHVTESMLRFTVTPE